MLKENKEKNFISAVVYIRNNEHSVKEYLEFINNFLMENFITYEIICVNDASTDKSVEKIKEFIKDNPTQTISLLNMSYFQGAEKSMQAGIDMSIGDYVYEFETTTISYNSNLLRKVYDKCLTGYDIVSAAPQNSNHKQAKCFYKLYNKVSNSLYKIRSEAFRILSRRAINRVGSMTDTVIYRKSAYANCGLKSNVIFYDSLKEIPHTLNEERSKQWETAVDALILYTDIAYKFSMSFAIVMILFTLMSGIYTGYMYMIGNSIKGWTTTMLLLSFGFFAVISILTILIKYTSLILKVVFHKQKYILESIEKLK